MRSSRLTDGWKEVMNLYNAFYICICADKQKRIIKMIFGANSNSGCFFYSVGLRPKEEERN